MYSKTIIGGAALAAVAMIPSCPAPPIAAAIITGIAAPLAGNLLYIGLNDNTKREASQSYGKLPRQEYPGVSQESIDACTAANNGRQVTVTETSANSMRIDNVAPECMDLSTLFVNDGTPQPCGSACLDYINLSDADKGSLMNIVNNLL
ncbi:MAG: hypothetical protein M4579_004493 [Chaenotheca gracillima]|nr:MAG: hypothetical protein M4579_004493 [Chaenotheca gracillima]